MKKTAVLIFILLSVLCTAEEPDTSFTIAPPPVGYPVIEKGKIDTITGGNLIILSTENAGVKKTFFGAGGFAVMHQCFTDYFAGNLSGGLALMIDDEASMPIVQVPLMMSGIVQLVNTGSFSAFVFAGAGGNLSASFMTIDIPQLVNMTLVTDPTSYTVTTTMGLVNAGLQFNITGGNFIISPFGIYSYTAGTYRVKQTSAMSFDYSYTKGLGMDGFSGRIDGYENIIFGLDVLYKPLDISLSSLIRSRDDFTVVSISFRKKYS